MKQSTVYMWIYVYTDMQYYCVLRGVYSHSAWLIWLIEDSIYSVLKNKGIDDSGQ